MNNKPFGIARTIYPKEKKCQKLTIDLDNNLDNDKTISGIIWQNLKNTIRWLTHSPIWNQEMLAHLKIWNQGSEQDLFACQIGLLSLPLIAAYFGNFHMTTKMWYVHYIYCIWHITSRSQPMKLIIVERELVAFLFLRTSSFIAGCLGKG